MGVARDEKHGAATYKRRARANSKQSAARTREIEKSKIQVVPGTQTQMEKWETQNTKKTQPTRIEPNTEERQRKSVSVRARIVCVGSRERQTRRGRHAVGQKRLFHHKDACTHRSAVAVIATNRELKSKLDAKHEILQERKQEHRHTHTHARTEATHTQKIKNKNDLVYQRHQGACAVRAPTRRAHRVNSNVRVIVTVTEIAMRRALVRGSAVRVTQRRRTLSLLLSVLLPCHR